MLVGVDGNEANVRERVGSNQYAFELLWALYRLKNPYSWVIYLRDKPLSDMPPVRKNWTYRVFGPKKFWTQWRLPLNLYIHRPRPDVFFSPGHYAPRWSPIPLVVSIMDLGYLKFPEQFTKKDLYQLTNWTARSIKKASHILTISESTKNDIIKEYKIPENRITVTYPGYDRKKFKIANLKFKIEKIKKRYKIPGDYILFLGSLRPSKNIEGLLSAYHTLMHDNPDLCLVVAGKKGWMYQGIFEKTKELSLEKRVIFTDYIPEEDVPALMSGAKVFIMPSFWEGFGIPVVEAMACGVPVVVSNAGSLPEVAGRAGVIVDPYKSEDIARGIVEALKNREALVKKGLEQVKKFSWEKCAKETLKVLEEVTAKKS
ncbi:MAG: glycosyltransferase family 4 protein [Patescibacteria group bacterium]